MRALWGLEDSRSGRRLLLSHFKLISILMSVFFNTQLGLNEPKRHLYNHSLSALVCFFTWLSPYLWLIAYTFLTTGCPFEATVSTCLSLVDCIRIKIAFNIHSILSSVNITPPHHSYLVLQQWLHILIHVKNLQVLAVKKERYSYLYSKQ